MKKVIRYRKYDTTRYRSGLGVDNQDQRWQHKIGESQSALPAGQSSRSGVKIDIIEGSIPTGESHKASRKITQFYVIVIVNIPSRVISDCPINL